MSPFPRPQILPYQDRSDLCITGRAVAGHGHIRLSGLPWHLVQGESENEIDCVKSSSTRRVLRLTEDVGAERPVVLFAKRNRVRTRPQGLLYRLYGSKAAREWKVGWRLVDRGLLTGRPVLLAERLEHGAVTESYLVTQAIRADCSLLTLLERMAARGEDPTPLLRSLGRFTAWLHGQRFYHDDLSPEHIWVDLSGEEPQFGLIDLDQSHFCTRLSRGRRLMNFFQVLRAIPPSLLTREQRMVFLEPFGGAQIVPEIEAIEKAKGATNTLG